VDYISAHGTSTPLNDAAEARAIMDVFGEHAERIAVSSTKSMAGHLIGAAGGVELIATAMSILHNRVHPSLNLEHPDPEWRIGFVRDGAQERTVRAALCNSFGFGGTNACVLLRRYEPRS